MKRLTVSYQPGNKSTVKFKACQLINDAACQDKSEGFALKIATMDLSNLTTIIRQKCVAAESLLSFSCSPHWKKKWSHTSGPHCKSY